MVLGHHCSIRSKCWDHKAYPLLLPTPMQQLMGPCLQRVGQPSTPTTLLQPQLPHRQPPSNNNRHNNNNITTNSNSTTTSNSSNTNKRSIIKC